MSCKDPEDLQHPRAIYDINPKFFGIMVFDFLTRFSNKNLPSFKRLSVKIFQVSHVPSSYLIKVTLRVSYSIASKKTNSKKT